MISKCFHIVVEKYVALALLIKKKQTPASQTTRVSSSSWTCCCCCFSLVQLWKPSPAQSVALSRFPPLSLSVCLPLALSLSLACALSFWTMTLRDSCNVRRLSILAGASKAEAEGRERAFIWDWGRWPPSFPFSFSPPFLPCLYVCLHILSSPHQQKPAKKCHVETLSPHSRNLMNEIVCVVPDYTSFMLLLNSYHLPIFSLS